ncbi:MAG: dehydrogenase [Phycisphaeraceae bacterium]|nr:dehydrogenase [Phycisphaeraceae bacterium]
MGRHHLEAMAQAGMTPSAVVELDRKRLAIAATDFPGIEQYDSVSAMLRRSGANLAAIITPHNTHAKLAIQCMRAGRHIVCEKPFAVTTAECDRMIEASRRHRVALSTYHNRHWDGCVLQALDIIRKGTIGEIVRAEAAMGGYSKPGDWWRSSRSISGGILYDWGVHFLEYALQLIDDRMVEVTGFAHHGFWAPKTPWKKDTIEDEASLVVRFARGAWLKLTMTTIDASPSSNWFEITGTQGKLEFDHQRWTTTVPRGARTVTTSGSNPPHQYQRFYANIRDHLVRGTPLIITPQWARRPIHVLDLAVQSARKGRAMRTKYD